MILLTGATGRIGRHLAQILGARGAPVRALSRHAGEQGAKSVDWVQADLSDRRSLTKVFAGADALFLLTGNDAEMVRLQKNALEAARDAGIPRIVKLSALGASDHSKSVIGLWHYNVESLLRQGTAAWTLLRPHHFMDNVLEQRADGVVFSPAGEGRIPFIATSDIAEVAAAVLTGSGHEGKTYVLTGPEAISYRDATAILARVTNTQLRYVPETEDEAWQRMRRAGEPVWRAAAMLALAEYQRMGGATERTTSTVRDLTGREARTFEQFAREHFG
jgi:uncharacterized protein YbjT (DUF2867 family)